MIIWSAGAIGRGLFCKIGWRSIRTYVDQRHRDHPPRNRFNQTHPSVRLPSMMMSISRPLIGDFDLHLAMSRYSKTKGVSSWRPRRLSN